MKNCEVTMLCWQADQAASHSPSLLPVMQWARAVSPIQLLEQHDPIFKWRAQMFDKFHTVVDPTVGFQQSLKAAK